MWRNRRIVVAGGTAGFGLVLARHLLAAGARVLLVGRSGEGVRRGLEACEPLGGDRAHGMTADLVRPGEGGRVVGEALRRLGGLDDLFCCVGRSGRADILQVGLAELQAAIDANLMSVVELTRAAVDDVATGRGHMVFMGSLAGKLVTPYMGPYAVGKSALAAYVDAVRLKVAARDVHVMLVSPGPIARATYDPAVDRAADRYAADVAAGKLPDAARAAGGSKRLTPLDPERLAARVLAGCRSRRSELVVPARARLLAGLIEWFPEMGRAILRRLA